MNSAPTTPPSEQALVELVDQIRQWSEELGFQQLGISDIDLAEYETKLDHWLAKGFHGEMDYMHKHGQKRSRPEQLVENTRRIISVRMDYMPPDAYPAEAILNDTSMAYVSRYALGRDYHKVIRKRLQQLASRIEKSIGEFGYRVFVDSAPVLEKAIAEKAGLGWIGKHSNLINKSTGSWFFLGEIYTDLPLPSNETKPAQHCGDCTACLDACPTDAIVSPYQVDARKCISYLTIELHGSIPEQYRKAMGNRIYGCDDCQLCCPWNRFTHETNEQDYQPRHSLDNISLIECFQWDEETFLSNTEGSAIRRIGYTRWLRNIAVALGNINNNATINKDTADDSITVKHSNSSKHRQLVQDAQQALKSRLGDSDLLDEHIHWALNQLDH